MEALGHLLQEVRRREIHAVEVHLDLEDLLAVARLCVALDADRALEPRAQPALGLLFQPGE